ncbi:MAG: ABC transporter permease [Anaerolineales bacterium]|nr:ABC transporter permease [Anaerolineales bacterium]
MTNYIIRRIIQAIPLLIIISLTVFVLMNLIPGGPMAAYENNPNISPEDLERLKKELGLDAPIHERYVNWLFAVVRGDWGISEITRRPALVEITEKLPNTLYLSLTAFFFALLVSIPIGIISAIRQYSWFDHLMTTVAFIGQAMPIFWFGLILIIIFNATIKSPLTGGPLLPGGGMFTIGAPFAIDDRVRHLILPASALIFFSLGSHIRYMRAGMLDVLHQDYIRTAYAKGLRERVVLAKHAFKNAVQPLVTIIGLEVPGLFAGAVITETIFSWPGMGRLFFNSIERGDYAVMMGTLMMSATLIVLFGLITDIVYAFLDPRIRFD